jgi:5-methylcytosine-specific restriction enzyme subunit McrC
VLDRRPLKEILTDGTLVDNRVFEAKDGLFIGGSISPITIYQGRGKNSPTAVWPLLQNASREIKEALRSGFSSKVLLFPNREYEHNTEDDFVQLQGSDPLNFILKTGNLIGCVKHNDYKLCVSSRFGDEFLKYIIADTDGFMELPEHGGESRGIYDWLLIYLWLIKLKKAFRLGPPKTYESRTESTTQVRGRLDTVDYVLNHKLARYRCTYREHSYNNEVTRLLAHTFRILDKHEFLRESHTLSQTFQFATQGRHTPLRDLLGTKPIRNPYYADYNPVVALSKQILRNEYADFGDQSQTSAFFFDVSMLFEYFIRKLLKRSGVSLCDKLNHELVIPSGLLSGYRRRKLIPDLIFDVGGDTYVFDVKYKSFDFVYGVSREDLFQLHTYIGQVSNQQKQLGGCGFIYPIGESLWHTHGLENTGGILSDTFLQQDHTIPFHVIFLKIPAQGNELRDKRDFRRAFKSACDAFSRKLLVTVRPS